MTGRRQRYRVLIGLNYPPGDKRAEPGAIVDDIPPGSVPWLVDAGAIEPVEPPGPGREIPEAKEVDSP